MWDAPVALYLDGGTAALLWQGAAAGVLGFLYAIRARIRGLLDRLRGRRQQDDDAEA